ncbi:MAG: DUF3795 domain-containing protein [Spirochaetaceae bacterium]|nr:DUF3795 domain-containing protein [Spirochaetaceae bacterium]
MENKMIAVCGLDCAGCDAFKATQANDDVMRAKVAAEWSKMNNAEILPEHINCGGCRTGNLPLFAYCGMCDMRKCAAERKIPHCGVCSDYPCESVSAVHSHAPAAAENLKALQA